MKKFFKSYLKHVKIMGEAIFFLLLLTIFYVLPFRASSAFGGTLARWVGPYLPITRKAYHRLERAIPGYDKHTYERWLIEMWENLGRTFAEYPHVNNLNIYDKGSQVEVEGGGVLEALHRDHQSAIFFLSHMANWELGTIAATQKGFKIAQVYRRVNNPLVAPILRWIHGKIAYELVEKGVEGARQMVEALKRGGHISILMDQKMNEGVSVPFFDRPAMTAPAIARLALKYKCALVPVQVERIGKTNFKVTFHSPLVLPQEGSQEEKVLFILMQVNKAIESWVKKRPGQWFWLHRRWSNE